MAIDAKDIRILVINGSPRKNSNTASWPKRRPRVHAPWEQRL